MRAGLSVRAGQPATGADSAPVDGSELAQEIVPHAVVGTADPLAIEPVIARSTLEEMPLGILIEDDRGRCWTNRELLRIWGRAGRTSVEAGELDGDLRPGPPRLARGGHPRPMRPIAGTARRWRHFILQRRDGTTVAVRVSRARFPGRSGASYRVAYVMQAGPREPDARLRQAFLAMIGHELRTPIASIVGGAELLHHRALDQATQEEVTGLVMEEANRVHLLIEQLTALTLVQSADAPLEAEPVHLVHLVRRVGAREARRRVGLDVRLPPLDAPRPVALGDEGFIAQVLAILIDNAAKHASSSSCVELTVEPARDRVAVHVLDRGPGLPAGAPARLFELFERAFPNAASPAGSGIGLYVAKQIIAAMGGSIWAKARAGGGADFGFSLPVAR